MSKWWRRGNSDHIMDKPWLAPNVIEYLEGLLTPDMKVCEHGSGGSTIWLAGRVARVVSYEANEKWFDALNMIRPVNVSMRYSKTHLGELDNNCDLLLIDGEPLTDRAEWLRMAKQIVKPGGVVVLDNANRSEYKAEREMMRNIADVTTFDNNEEGTLYLVTEFYRMPK